MPVAEVGSITRGRANWWLYVLVAVVCAIAGAGLDSLIYRTYSDFGSVILVALLAAACTGMVLLVNLVLLIHRDSGVVSRVLLVAVLAFDVGFMVAQGNTKVRQGEGMR